MTSRSSPSRSAARCTSTSSPSRSRSSRDAAAQALGIGRPLAVFHLDKLVEAGLLEASFRRLSGKTGPGAGRPAKLYGRSLAGAPRQPAGAPL